MKKKLYLIGKDKKMKKKLLKLTALLMAAIMILPTAILCAAEPEPITRSELIESMFTNLSESSDEWVIFDMALYGKLKGETMLSDDTIQKYLNNVIEALSAQDISSTERTKAEVILASIGVDSTKLYPLNSAEAIDNAKLLKEGNIESYYSAPLWTLIADLQGNTDYSDEQLASFIDVLSENQICDGLIGGVYGSDVYPDADSTGWALAALSKYSFDEASSLHEKSCEFINTALEGLSNAQGENGSFGNVCTDAMVITGLISLGIDPSNDERFVKSGNSLADALMLYVNSTSDGFAEPDDPYGAFSNEQGFRGLLSLELFEKSGYDAINIYVSDMYERKPAYTSEEKSSEQEPKEHLSENNITVSLNIKAVNKVIFETELEVSENSSLKDALSVLAEKENIKIDDLNKGYIKSITYGGKTYKEFGYGESSGWLYYVNGELPNVGIADYVLNNDDTVLLLYTADYTLEDKVFRKSEASSSKGKDTKTVKADMSVNEQPVESTDTKQTVPEWKNPYKDINSDYVYYDAIKFVSEKGIMNGTNNNTFAPDDILTRAMLITVIYRAENPLSTYTCLFEDVKETDWYYAPVSWAYNAGLIKGVSESLFAPDEDITGEQLNIIIERYAKYKGENKVDYLIFPTDKVTRIQAAQMIKNFLN